MFKKNLGRLDKFIRTAIALSIATLYFTNAISGSNAMILGVIALILLGSSLLSFCPFYFILGISSCK